MSDSWKDGYLGCYLCGKPIQEQLEPCAEGHEHHLWGVCPLPNPAFADLHPIMKLDEEPPQASE